MRMNAGPRFSSGVSRRFCDEDQNGVGPGGRCEHVALQLGCFRAGARWQLAKSTEAEGGYGYEFSDDPLNAGGFGPGDATIRVRPVAVRAQLIKPRTSFVPEMLKSVENL